MKTTMRTLLLTAILFIGCAGYRPDPITAVPVESDLIIAVVAPKDISVKIAPIVEIIPDLGGVFDLVRSLTGLDLQNPAALKAEGLDQNRGIVLAAYSDAILAVLPVEKSKVAGRRIGLRLARLGLIEEDDTDGIRRFHDESGKTASLIVRPRLAVICLGPDATCDQVFSAKHMENRQRLDDFKAELRAPAPDIIGFVGNQRLETLADMVGLAIPKSGFVRTLLGDLRFTLSFNKGIEITAAIGAPGEPYKSRIGRQELTGAARLFTQFGVLPLQQTPFGHIMKTDWFKAWDGRLLLTIPRSNPKQLRPLAQFSDIGKLPVQLSAGFKTPEMATKANEQLSLMFPSWQFDMNLDKSKGLKQEHLLELQIDPGALIEASGIAVIDFVRHLATNLESIEALVVQDGLRFVLEAALKVRLVN